jgi:hypothetical protein
MGRAEDLASGPPDLRGVRWGMTQQQVRARESGAPRESRGSNGERVMEYRAVPFARLSGRLFYFFVDGKLVRAKYLVEAEHDNLNDFIGDFRSVDAHLREMRGKPAAERAVWTNDSTQTEPKSYLEQDRSSPADILPSDKLVGLAVSLGHLKLFTRWESARTSTLHGLTGENSRIIHQVEQSSAEYESRQAAIRTPR